MNILTVNELSVKLPADIYEEVKELVKKYWDVVDDLKVEARQSATETALRIWYLTSDYIANAYYDNMVYIPCSLQLASLYVKCKQYKYLTRKIKSMSYIWNDGKLNILDLQTNVMSADMPWNYVLDDESIRQLDALTERDLYAFSRLAYINKYFKYVGHQYDEWYFRGMMIHTRFEAL